MKFTFDKSNGGHTYWVGSLVSLENGYLASGSYDGSVKIWDITNRKLKFTFEKTNGGHSSFIQTLTWLDNGFLAMGYGQWIVEIDI